VSSAIIHFFKNFPSSFHKITLLITAADFRARLRFPRAAVSLLVAALLRGLTCLAFPAGVFVLHSNQQLKPAVINNNL
jgi:hypothetical protein